MAITDLFFKRQKRERGEYPDVYQYEEIAEKLKIQIIHIWDDCLTRDNKFHNNRDDKIIHHLYKILCKELGVFKLDDSDNPQGSLLVEIMNFFLKEMNHEIALSVIELMSKAIFTKDEHNITRVVDEINGRFKEHGVGYQLENNQIIKIDSQYVHSEAIKPVLSILNQKDYKGAQQEFLRAHEHYRKGAFEETLVECLKSYESTLKIIFKKRGWDYSDKDTADSLTGKAMQNGLVPDYLAQYFKSLKNTLTSGVPTVRNKEAGHGQGEFVRNVPEHLVAYILNITASAILFLAKCETNLK